MKDLCDRHYSRAGIHGRVVHEIGREIVSGIFKPGEKLPAEADFMLRFQGSRTVIREAFRVLSAKGLLIARQRAGTRVRCKRYWNLLDPDVLVWQSPDKLDAKSVRNLMEVRASVEPTVARLAAERATEQEIGELQDICCSMERAENAGNNANAFEAELKFHLTLFEVCHNDFISRMQYMIQSLLVYGYGRQELRLSLLAGTAMRHRALVDRLRAGDLDGSETAARSIIERSNELLNQILAASGRIRQEVA